MQLKQPQLFPQWQETTRTAEIWAQALRLARTPAKPVTAKNGRIRPVIDGVETQWQNNTI